MRGDRTDRMFDYLPYDMVSGQWRGIVFHGSSYGNAVSYTDVHGTYDGIVCDSTDVSRSKLQLYNSTVHNCQGYGLKAVNSAVDVRNCQITNTLNDCVAVFGGKVSLTHCTIAQFYPFDSNRGVALRYANHDGDTKLPLERMDCVNTIVTGYGEDMVMADDCSTEGDSTVFNYSFFNSLLRTRKVDDNANIVGTVWEDVKDTAEVLGEKNFRLVDIDMQRYDFHLDSLSYAIDKADKELSLPLDRDGRQRGELPDIGCYEFVKNNEEQEQE